MTIRAILCDIDDVVRYWDGFDTVEQDHGLPAHTLASTAFQRDLMLPAFTGEITTQQWHARVEQKLRDRDLTELAVTALMGVLQNNTFTIDQQVLDWLAAARTRMPVWMFTNQSDNYAAKLRGTGIVETVDGVISSSDIGAMKPDPRSFQRAAERVGVAVERCLFIDDRAENTEAAAALGMATVLYRTFADLHGVLDRLPG